MLGMLQRFLVLNIDQIPIVFIIIIAIDKTIILAIVVILEAIIVFVIQLPIFIFNKLVSQVVFRTTTLNVLL